MSPSMANGAYCLHRTSGTVHFLMTVTLLIILSRATLTSTLASCNADPSLGLADRTKNAETVLAGTLVKLEGDSTFYFKVFQVLKGDEKLYRRKIKIRISDVTTAPSSRDESVVAPSPSTRAYPVAMTTPEPLSPRCFSGAVVGEKYIVFVQRVGNRKRTFEMVFEGVPQTKRAIKAVKIAVEESMTTEATTATRVLSTVSISQMTTEGDILTTNGDQQSTNAEDTDDNGVPTNTDYLPKTSDAHFEPCAPRYDAYCFNQGMCHWVSGISQPSCECVDGYRGERCQFKSLEAANTGRLFGDYWEVFIIGTIFGIVILLTLIGAIVYVVRKRKETQTRRQNREEAADAFIQSNYRPSDDIEQQQQPDDNQNKTPDRYIRLTTNEPYPIVETAVDSEALPTTTFGNNSHSNSAGSFRLKDPPFRKGSNHSTVSASKESTV